LTFRVQDLLPLLEPQRRIKEPLHVLQQLTEPRRKPVLLFFSLKKVGEEWPNLRRGRKVSIGA